MAVNTWDGATDTDWNTAGNWNTTGVTDRVPTADDDVVIANVSNNCVMPDGLNPTINSLLVESSASLTAGNNNITIDSHPASGTNRSIDLSGTFVKGTSTLTFTYSAAETKYLNFRGVEVHNVVINGANTTFAIGNGALTASGNLTITAGTLNTFSAQNNAITVTGHVSVTGTLTGNASAIEFGSLTIASGGTYNATSGTTIIDSTQGGYSWYAPTTGSIFNHNNGTVKLTYTGNETFWQGTGFYNLEIAGSTHYEHRYDDLTDGSGLTIFNNFTITEGRVRFNQGGDNVTVHGLTKMVSGQYGNTGTAPSGTHNYGNVVIEGGTWKVTSGTCNMSGIRKLGGTLS